MLQKFQRLIPFAGGIFYVVGEIYTWNHTAIAPYYTHYSLPFTKQHILEIFLYLYRKIIAKFLVVLPLTLLSLIHSNKVASVTSDEMTILKVTQDLHLLNPKPAFQSSSYYTSWQHLTQQTLPPSWNTSLPCRGEFAGKRMKYRPQGSSLLPPPPRDLQGVLAMYPQGHVILWNLQNIFTKISQDHCVFSLWSPLHHTFPCVLASSSGKPSCKYI